MVRSRLSELLALKSREEGRKIQGQEVAEKTGLNKGTVSSWMSLEPFTRIDYPTAKALADFFGMSWHEMIYEDIIEEQSSADPA